MHELGIAASILERVQQETAQRSGARAIKVGVRIGELSGVDPDALSFAFEALLQGTPLEGLGLEIDYQKRMQRCSQCSREYESSMLFTVCPGCGSLETACIAGDEIDLVFIELEDPACV